MKHRGSRLFDAAHLALLRRALGDEAAFEALADSLARLETIIHSAKRRGCTLLRCTLRRVLSVQMDFRSPDGASFNASLSFRRKYRRCGKELSHETALALRLCIESLVAATRGFTLMKRARRGGKQHD